MGAYVVAEPGQEFVDFSLFSTIWSFSHPFSFLSKIAQFSDFNTPIYPGTLVMRALNIRGNRHWFLEYLLILYFG